MLRHICAWCCFAVALAGGGMLRGAETAREIFTRLSTLPSCTPEQARVLPGTGLPVDADLVLTVRDVSENASVLAQLSGMKLRPEWERGSAYVKDAALVLGRGYSLPLADYISQVQSLRRWEGVWTSRARAQVVPAIRRAFRRQEHVCKEDLLHAVKASHGAPVYLVLTAEPGQEKGFAAMHCQAIEILRQLAGRGDGTQFLEYGDFRGIRMSRRRAWELFTGSSLSDPDISGALEQKDVYLLTTLREGVALTVLCERPTDMVLPERTAHASVLENSKTSSSEVCATFYASPELCRARQNLLTLRRLNLAQACVNALREAYTDEPQHAAAYGAAQESLCELVDGFGETPQCRVPLIARLRKSDSGMLSECTADALQAEFHPGTLQHTEQADTPNAVVYSESTAFTCPAALNLVPSRDRVGKHLPIVCQGVALTLKRGAQRTPAYFDFLAQMLGEDSYGLMNALCTMRSGMNPPLTFVAAQPANRGLPLSWTLGAAVAKRAALFSGWRQLLNGVGQVSEGFGIPAALVDVLPVRHSVPAKGIDAYSLGLPGFGGLSLPNVVLSDREVALGNNAALNTRLITHSSPPLPFCGAVCSVHFPSLADTMRHVRSSCPQLADSAVRLAGLFEHLYAVFIIRDGAISIRAYLSPEK